ncbi:MAG: GldG family protein [Sandaracinaceae bacterium]|nr:GldG family protein [Sandaracinaceae bacterium]
MRRQRGMSVRLQNAIYGVAASLVITAAWFFAGPAGVAVSLVVSLIGRVLLAGYQARAFERRGGAHTVAVRRDFWVGLLLPLGLVLLFVSERVVGGASEQIAIWRSTAGFAIVAALAWRGYRLATSKGAARKVEVRLSVATAGVVAALVVYALSTEAGVEWLGLEGSAAERTAGTFGVLWVALVVVSLGALLFMEMAYRVMPVEEAVELRRVDASGANGLTLGLSLVFVVSMNYVATQRDVTRDLSYFKTTRPSERSLAMARSLDEPVKIVLFYPRVHEVLDQLQPYFEELDEASEQLTVEVLDHALAPELARQHRVRGNGFVLLLRGEGEGQQAESFEIGTELEAARSRLRTLDGRFQQHFAQLTIRPRELYLTTGHRERSASGGDGDPTDQRLGELSAALQRSNITSRDLGMAQGLANRVPESAPAVAVVGPREPFLEEEAQSLLRYVRGGGRLVVFVDPDVEHGLEPLLRGLGVTLKRGVLHSEQNHLRRGEPPADRAVVFSNNYSAHPTVTLATRYRRAPSVFDRGGALERREEGQLEGVSVTFPLWGSEGYWLDLDDDHAQGEGERGQGRLYWMAAVTVPNAGGQEGRAVVIADGDFITDRWIRNAGNAFVLMDTLNWLVGEEQVFGPTQTEEDIPIEHTREEDKAWFYGTSFAMPLPLLLLGFWLAMRKRGGRVQDHRGWPG